MTCLHAFRSVPYTNYPRTQSAFSSVTTVLRSSFHRSGDRKSELEKVSDDIQRNPSQEKVSNDIQRNPSQQ